MKKNILIVGGTGLVGNKIARLLKERNQNYTLFIGSRKSDSSVSNTLHIDVNAPETFKPILENNIWLVVLSTNDKADNILIFCIENGIDYIDISKPSPDLEKAYRLAQEKTVTSRIVFSSGWMSGIVGSLVSRTEPNIDAIKEVNVFVYYSINDLAGVSSAFFMAENVAKPFKIYQGNKPIPVKHFLNSVVHNYSFGIGNRQAYNFDTPDLFILNKIEGIPTVEVKTTYSSKPITRLLQVLQSLRIFSILPLSLRKLLFSANGTGDQTIFDIVVNTENGSKQVSVQDISGQAHLTALSTVLHIETMQETDQNNGVYFSHQLHTSSKIYDLLNSENGIIINTTNRK